MDSLSPELLEMIVDQLDRSCEYRAYLMSLRLVNKEFNDIIIRIVFVHSPDHKPLRPSHIFSCAAPSTCFCRQYSFKDSIYSDLYMRSYLQGELMTLRSKTPEHLDFLVNINTAVEILRGIATKKIPILSALVQEHPHPKLMTTDILFHDPYQIVICDAILCRFDPERYFRESYLHQKAPRRTYPIALLVLMAVFYLGNADAIEQILMPENAVQLLASSEEIENLLSECVFVAVLKCSPTVVESLLRGHLREGKFHANEKGPLDAAFITGDESLFNLVLHYYSEADFTDLAWHMLIYHNLWRASCKKDQLLLLKQLVDKCDEPENLGTIYALWRICRYDSNVNLLQQILDDGDDARNEELGSKTWAIKTALTLTGHADDLWEVLTSRCQYWDSRRDWAVQAFALDWNKIDIFHLLIQGLPSYEEDAELFVRLGGVDGAIPEMQKRLNLFPDLLDNCDYEHRYGEPVGEAALQKAMQCLKSVNVKYLLDFGVRPNKVKQPTIFWSEYKAHKQEFEVTQLVLKSFDLPQLKISY